MITIKKKIIFLLIVFGIASIFILPICISKSIVIGDWTKQTVYLWILNSWHIQAKDANPELLLIDDDCGNGIFCIKQLCDELQLKATFAIVPNLMDEKIVDSLKCWQRHGYGIALHGYNHDDWRNWTYKKVVTDIEKSEKWLQKNQFDMRNINYIVSPHGANNRAIRNAIKDKGYQMVTGANLLNPDTMVFQLGRLMITKNTDLEGTRGWLEKAKERKLFVIIGTHSSISDEFSIDKTKAVLQMAMKMGFKVQH